MSVEILTKEDLQAFLVASTNQFKSNIFPFRAK